MKPSRRFATVAALGSAQTLAWASSYYLPAILAAPIARDMNAPSAMAFAILHSIGNGILTIAIGTLPLLLTCAM